MGEIPQTRFVRSGEVDLAYQIFGAGDDLVLISGGPSHLEVIWELAELAAFLDRLASFRRVIIFDKRGTGMSDPVPGVPALEEHVDDVITVMDAAGSVRACVAGWADAAFVAAMFTATYPERVSALILGGLWLKALAGRPETLAPDPVVLDTSPAPVRSWSPAPCRCSSSAPASASPTGGATRSREFPTGGTCSPWNTPDQALPGRSVSGAKSGVAGCSARGRRPARRGTVHNGPICA